MSNTFAKLGLKKQENNSREIISKEKMYERVFEENVKQIKKNCTAGKILRRKIITKNIEKILENTKLTFGWGHKNSLYLN